MTSGRDEARAEEAACKMEHAMPRAIFERFLKFLHFVDECPRAGAQWAEEFRNYCAKDGAHEDCGQCNDAGDGDPRRNP